MHPPARHLLQSLPVKKKVSSGSGLRRFVFDGVFNQDQLTPEVYLACCLPAVEHALNGSNATCIAYGMTGSGKTHTVVGGKEPGFIQLAAIDILRSRDIMNVSCSYVQIYNSIVTDLFASRDKYQDLRGLRLKTNASDGQVEVENAIHLPLESPADVLTLIRKGNARRNVCAHRLNSTSSRSHAIFTYHLNVGTGASSKLHFVDLAGSERVADSGVSGANLKEAIGELK